jgi:hypothetical protein
VNTVGSKLFKKVRSKSSIHGDKGQYQEIFGALNQIRAEAEIQA